MHSPTLRPANTNRSLMHIVSGVGVLGLIHVVSDPVLKIIAVAFAILAWGLELGRRVSPDMNRFLMWLFGPVAHAHEARTINSSTWYTTALLALALAGSTLWASVGVAVLGIGDPTAALVGRKYGTHRLVSGRSLEGSLAFVASGALASYLTLRLFYAEVLLIPALAYSLVGAICGAIAELCSEKIDDNLLIPLAAAGGAALTGVFF